MSALPKRLLSASEYLVIERAAEFRSEFFQGEMFAMAGASREHNGVKEKIIGELYAQLRGGSCRTLSSDQRVMVDATGLYTYPDIVIRCGPGEYDPKDRDTLLNPTAIIEILSPSTERYDRVAKFRNYRQIPSLKEYILVAQDEAICERYSLQPDGIWTYVSFIGLEEVLVLTSVTASVPLAEIYAGVEFPEPGKPQA
jgi:Uma2 family endonuclease